MVPPIFSFMAPSGTGKTTFIEKLVPLLKARGLNVGVIKHDAHDFEVDTEGKDTWRFTRAGADMVSILSETHAALMVQRKMTFSEMAETMRGMDILLSEGYEICGSRVIGVFRAQAGFAPLLPPEALYAAVTDTPLDAPALQFPLDDPEPLSEHLARVITQEERLRTENAT